MKPITSLHIQPIREDISKKNVKTMKMYKKKLGKDFDIKKLNYSKDTDVIKAEGSIAVSKNLKIKERILSVKQINK
jgi:hypothetical protein